MGVEVGIGASEEGAEGCVISGVDGGCVADGVVDGLSEGVGEGLGGPDNEAASDGVDNGNCGFGVSLGAACQL